MSAEYFHLSGYEARSRPWKPELEERIIGKVHELVEKTSFK